MINAIRSKRDCMNFNQQMIIKYVCKYKVEYLEQFGQIPTSWFTYFRWIASFTPAGSFNEEDVRLGKLLFGDRY